MFHWLDKIWDLWKFFFCAKTLYRKQHHLWNGLIYLDKNHLKQRHLQCTGNFSVDLRNNSRKFYQSWLRVSIKLRNYSSSSNLPRDRRTQMKEYFCHDEVVGQEVSISIEKLLAALSSYVVLLLRSSNIRKCRSVNSKTGLCSCTKKGTWINSICIKRLSQKFYLPRPLFYQKHYATN